MLTNTQNYANTHIYSTYPAYTLSRFTLRSHAHTLSQAGTSYAADGVVGQGDIHPNQVTEIYVSVSSFSGLVHFNYSPCVHALSRD